MGRIGQESNAVVDEEEDEKEGSMDQEDDFAEDDDNTDEDEDEDKDDEQEFPSGEEAWRETPDGGCLCYALRTGFSSSQVSTV